MHKRTSIADYLQDWETLLAALEENASDVPQTEIARTKLLSLLGRARSLMPLQAAQAAAKQTTSQQLDLVVTTGRKAASVIRFILKEHYGNRSEKLAEFRIQPFRSRTPLPLPAPEIAAVSEAAEPAPANAE